MSASYDLSELQDWDARIREKVGEFGLNCFPQEFEVCDHTQMLSAMAYSGMPSHYPHWSYGKGFERQKTLYDHGVSGLPYEMVINSDPSIAYLMRDNTLCLQILTIAHVYGHNDFFRNNFTFGHIRAEHVVQRFKSHADRIRTYTESPSIGEARVEAFLDSAHALSFQCRRNPAMRKLSGEDQEDWVWERAQPPSDPYKTIHKPQELEAPDLNRLPLEPEEDILLFIRDYNPRLEDWQRDVLTIVHDEALYFLPQIETKIINEGWACYWHRAIMNSLDLPADLHMEFLVRHNQVVRPSPGSINPYHLGLLLWDDIVRRYDDPTAEERETISDLGKSGREKIMEIREADRDASFLRRFLDEKLMRQADLFEYETRGNQQVVSKVSDEENWSGVKETLLRNVGTAAMPVIRIVDADCDGSRTMLLHHAFEGRELELGYAEKTLSHLQALWGRQVSLQTRLQDDDVILSHDGDGFQRANLH
jgi:stage V sporulation protein R